MKIQLLFPLFLVLALFCSCNDEETPPAFFVFEDFTFVNNPAASIDQGSLRHNIKAGFFTLRPVEAGGFSDDLGVQNIPSSFPYLGSGNKIITITPQVPINGSRTTLDDHPHMEPTVYDDFLVEELETYPLDLEFKYKSDEDIEFLLNEDFEGDNHTFLDFENDTMQGTFIKSIENVYEGNASGQIVLNDANREIIAYSLGSFPLSANKLPFLEFDANTDVSLQFGYRTDVGESAILGGANPTDGEWKKFYFDIRESVNFDEMNGVETYELFWIVAIESGEESPNIFLDNVKLIQAR